MFSKSVKSALFDKTFSFVLDFSSIPVEELDTHFIKLEFKRLRDEAFNLVVLMERATPEHVSRHTPVLVETTGGRGAS